MRDGGGVGVEVLRGRPRGDCLVVTTDEPVYLFTEEI